MMNPINVWNNAVLPGIHILKYALPYKFEVLIFFLLLMLLMIYIAFILCIKLLPHIIAH